jgi:prefoldin subunit 5
MISQLHEQIKQTEQEIEALESKRAEIEKFLQRLNTRSHPLRRAAVA